MTAVPTNLYEVLELLPNCSQSDIRRQYKKLALKYHPDKNTDASPTAKKHAEQMFKAIAKAYEILHHEDRRKQYDLEETEGSHLPTHHPSTTGGSKSHQRFGYTPDPYAAPFGRREHHQSAFANDSFFSSVFEPMMGGGFFGSKGGSFAAEPFSHSAHQGVRAPSFLHSFAFGDPFGLFERMMNDDIFGDNMFRRMGGNVRTASHAHLPPPQPRRMLPIFEGSGFGDMMGFGAGDPFFGDFFSDMTPSRAGGASHGRIPTGGVFQSVFTTTEVRNGQRVTRTIRRSQDANGVVREDVDEEIANVNVDSRPRISVRHPPPPAATVSAPSRERVTCNPSPHDYQRFAEPARASAAAVPARRW